MGIKAVNALSSQFYMESSRDGESKRVEFSQGLLSQEDEVKQSGNGNGTLVGFTPDKDIFGDYQFRDEHIEPLLKNYVFLNTGLTITFNGKKFNSKNGLEDLLNENLTSEELYPIIHLHGEDIEVAITHTNQYGEEYYSFVNGQHTTQGEPTRPLSGRRPPRHQGVLQPELRVLRYPEWYRGGHQHQGRGTNL